MPPNRNFTINASNTSCRNRARILCISWVFLTAGISGYGGTAALFSSSIGISFSLGVVASDASASEGLLTSSGASIGVRTLAEALVVKLTLELLVDAGVRDARRFTRTVLVLAGGGITTGAGSSSARLPLGFAAGCVCEATFAEAFCVGCLPFVVAFVFSGGWSPSLELVVGLLLELDDINTF